MIDVRRLFAPNRPEPSYPALPRLDGSGRTSVPGVYAVGELAGAPLVKNGINAGHEVVGRVAGEIAAERRGGAAAEGCGRDAKDDDRILDLAIVGAGAAGLAAAAAAKERGLSAVVLEAGRLAETVRQMTKGKTIRAEPAGVATKGALWFEECTREELLAKWAAQVAELGLDVHEGEPVEDIRRAGGTLEVTTARRTYRARRVVLAVGKAGQPRHGGDAWRPLAPPLCQGRAVARVGVPGCRDPGDRGRCGDGRRGPARHERRQRVVASLRVPRGLLARRRDPDGGVPVSRREGLVPLLVPAGRVERRAGEVVRAAADRIERQVHLLHAVFAALPGGRGRHGLRAAGRGVRQPELRLHPVRHLHVCPMDVLSFRQRDAVTATAAPNRPS